MMETYKVGIIGATGMVGQRFIMLMDQHPWFETVVLAASPRSAGKSYVEAVGKKWCMDADIPAWAKTMTVMDADADAAKIAELVDFVFCAVDMPKEAIQTLEYKYAGLECPVVSNNSAHRMTPDVPMVIPEINNDHIQIIDAQKKRLGTRRGFIAVKSNCSLQSYVPALSVVKERFGLNKVLVCTYQAISGAGKTFDMWPEMIDNVIPYIGGEEEKSEQEPMKIWGTMQGGEIVCASSPSVTAQCLRVPVSNGHMAAVFASFDRPVDLDEIKHMWRTFQGRPQELSLPHAPKQFIRYFEDDNMPQTRLQRDLEGGMAISVGRLRRDTQYDLKFVCLSHNTLRGAAGGAVLLGELLCAEGYITKK